MFPPPAGYLQGLRRLCDEHDASLVASDAQVDRCVEALAAALRRVQPRATRTQQPY